MNKKRKNDQKNLIILIIFILLVLLLGMLILINIMSDFSNTSTNEDISINVILDTEAVIESEKEEELDNLKEMTERSRIEYYISSFIRNLEEKKYEDAYSVLNREFKEQYFPSLKDLKEYSENKFSQMLDVKFTNIERNGQIYVSWLTITDAINGSKDSGEEMNFVVKEKDFNDFELSFSVK